MDSCAVEHRWGARYPVLGDPFRAERRGDRCGDSKEALDRAVAAVSLSEERCAAALHAKVNSPLSPPDFRLCGRGPARIWNLPQPCGRSAEPDAATLCRVSVGSVQNARRISREGTPEDVKAMLGGTPLGQIIHTITARKRADRDFYRTPNPCVELAAALMDKSLRWWEPCAGDGAISSRYPELITLRFRYSSP